MALSVEFVKGHITGGLSLQRVRDEAVKDLKGIDRVKKPISYKEFFTKYLLRNVPCVLTKWATEGWKSRSCWCKDEKISWDALENMFGGAVAPVANCSEQKSYSQAKTDMTVKDFISYVRKNKTNGQDSDLLYLKDWHFTREFPEYEAYKTPPYFLSDWLNEFWENRTDCDNTDDYRFVYIGPKGSWTPFHTDVFLSYSWSANICGRKRWILFAPGYEKQIKDSFGNLPFDLRDVNFEEYTQLEKHFEIIQESGEVIFVPSGWSHQVINMEDTISINHNWINACNVDICWRYLNQQLLKVEKEISEHRQMENWNKHCQLILRADTGMDFIDFYNLLYTIASHRIKNFQQHIQKGISCERDISTIPLVGSQKQISAIHEEKAGKNLAMLTEGSSNNVIQQILLQNDNTHSSVCMKTFEEVESNNALPASLEELRKTDKRSEYSEGKFYDILGHGHAFYDLLQIQSLLESDFSSECLMELGETRILGSPDILVSRIRSIIAANIICEAC